MNALLLSAIYLLSIGGIIAVYEARIRDEVKRARSEGYYEGLKHKVMQLPETPEDQE